jgi:hypothetical protein
MMEKLQQFSIYEEKLPHLSIHDGKVATVFNDGKVATFFN